MMISKDLSILVTLDTCIILEPSMPVDKLLVADSSWPVTLLKHKRFIAFIENRGLINKAQGSTSSPKETPTKADPYDMKSLLSGIVKFFF